MRRESPNDRGWWELLLSSNQREPLCIRQVKGQASDKLLLVDLSVVALKPGHRRRALLIQQNPPLPFLVLACLARAEAADGIGIRRTHYGHAPCRQAGRVEATGRRLVAAVRVLAHAWDADLPNLLQLFSGFMVDGTCTGGLRHVLRFVSYQREPLVERLRRAQPCSWIKSRRCGRKHGCRCTCCRREAHQLAICAAT